MKTQIFASLVIIAILSSAALAQSKGIQQGKMAGGGTITSAGPMQNPNVNPNGKFQPRVPEQQIEFIASRTTEQDDIVMTLDINGNLYYSHNSGNPHLNPKAIDIEIVDTLPRETVILAFGVLSAAGFMEFPAEFPSGGSYKDGYDIWMTQDGPEGGNSVFAAANALVSAEFNAVRNVFEALVDSIENRVILQVDVFAPNGSFVGSMEVQADGDALVRKNSENPNAASIIIAEKHLDHARMDIISHTMAKAGFFHLPTCSEYGASGSVVDPYSFEVTYSADGNSRTLRFGDNSEVGRELRALTSWVANLVD